MKYPVVVCASEEGFTVGCPGLPGCWSEGNTIEEALENIKIAIVEYEEVSAEIATAKRATRLDRLLSERLR